MTTDAVPRIRLPRLRSASLCLAVLLALSEACYLYLLKTTLAEHAIPATTFVVVMAMLFLLYGFACIFVQSQPGKQRKLLLVLASGTLLFRATLLPVGLSSGMSMHQAICALRADLHGQAVTYDRFFFFDDDLWRYLWDGHVSAAGVNPFQYPPNAHELDELSTQTGNATLWTKIRLRVNHPALGTVYPPAAQWIFRLAHWVAPGSVLAFKIINCLLDLVAIGFIALALRALHRPMTDVIWYAWNPLVVAMVSGSGHIDALTAAAVSATGYFVVQKKAGMAGVSFALSIAGKIAPLALLLLMIKRLRWRGTGIAFLTLGAVYLPFWIPASWENLAVYIHRWQFNSAWFYSLVWLLRPIISDPSYVARIISGTIAASMIVWFAFYDTGEARPFFSSAAAVLGIFLLLSPTIMPWYLVWLLPLAVIARQQIWIYFSALVCLSVFMMTDWQPHASILVIEYGAFLALIAWQLCKMQMEHDRSVLQNRQEQASIPAIQAQ